MNEDEEEGGEVGEIVGRKADEPAGNGLRNEGQEEKRDEWMQRR